MKNLAHLASPTLTMLATLWCPVLAGDAPSTGHPGTPPSADPEVTVKGGNPSEYRTHASTVSGIKINTGDAPAREQAVDIDARKRTIPVLEERIKEREERVGELAADITTLYERLDSRIDRIVKKIASIKDSEQSGYRVSQVKKEAMEGLGRAIKNLQNRRSDLLLEARRNTTVTPTGVIEGDAAKFDEKIEKRVHQILEVSKSFTQSADVKKYQRVAGGGYYDTWGYDGGGYEISGKWRQNRRDRTMNKVQRDEIIAALKKSVARHESLASDLRAILRSNRYSPTDRELMSMELKRHERISCSLGSIVNFNKILLRLS